jgi:hypothetical protein
MAASNENKHADNRALTLIEALTKYHKAFSDDFWSYRGWQNDVDGITCAIDELLNIEIDDEEGEVVPHNEEQQAAIDALAAIVGDYRALPDWTYERLREAVPLATMKEFKRIIGQEEGRCLWYVHSNNLRQKLVGPISQRDAVLYRRLLEKQGFFDTPQLANGEKNSIQSQSC